MNQKVKDALKNFQRAFDSLEKALSKPVTEDRDLAGIIQNFEFVFELAWKNLKRILESEGQTPRTPRDSIAQAFQAGFVDDEKIWLQMIEDRNLTVHTYNPDLAQAIFQRIQKDYFPQYRKLRALLEKKRS